MRVTTVVCVTVQMIFFQKKSMKEAATNSIHRYVIIQTTIRPHDPFVIRHIDYKEQNTAADSYRAPSRIANSQRKQPLRATFDRYVVIRHTIHSHDPISTLHSNSKRRIATSDTYGAFPSSPIFSPPWFQLEVSVFC